jgi:hypothetical protein
MANTYLTADTYQTADTYRTADTYGGYIPDRVYIPNRGYIRTTDTYRTADTYRSSGMILRSVPGRVSPSDYRRDDTAEGTGAVVSRLHLDLPAGSYRGKYRYGILPSTSRATGGVVPRKVPMRDHTGGGKSGRYDSADT